MKLKEDRIYQNIRKLYNKLKYHWHPKEVNIQRTFLELLNNKKNIFFVQIGANDGKGDDPIHELILERNWNGILLEPQKWVFENQLKKTYENNKNLVLLNAALSKEDGFETFYKLSFTNDNWATGLGSFRKETIQKHIDEGYVDYQAQRHNIITPSNKEDYIASEEVATITFDTIIDKFNISKISLLAIDTEGFDHEVIKLVNLNSIKPEIILFEHKHLDLNEYKSTIKLLKKFNYTLRRDSANTLAYIKP